MVPTIFTGCPTGEILGESSLYHFVARVFYISFTYIVRKNKNVIFLADLSSSRGANELISRKGLEVPKLLISAFT